MAWAAGPYDVVSIGFTDADDQTKTSKIRVLAGTSNATIEAFLAKMQVQSDMSIASYVRHVARLDDAADPANAFDPATHPYALLSEALDLEYSCGPKKQATRTSVLGPKPTNIIQGGHDKSVLDPASGSFTDLETTGIAAMVNTAGQPPTQLQRTQIETRKSSQLE